MLEKIVRYFQKRRSLPELDGDPGEEFTESVLKYLHSRAKDYPRLLGSFDKAMESIKRKTDRSPLIEALELRAFFIDGSMKSSLKKGLLARVRRKPRQFRLFTIDPERAMSVVEQEVEDHWARFVAQCLANFRGHLDGLLWFEHEWRKNYPARAAKQPRPDLDEADKEWLLDKWHAK